MDEAKSYLETSWKILKLFSNDILKPQKWVCPPRWRVKCRFWAPYHQIVSSCGNWNRTLIVVFVESIWLRTLCNRQLQHKNRPSKPGGTINISAFVGHPKWCRFSDKFSINETNFLWVPGKCEIASQLPSLLPNTIQNKTDSSPKIHGKNQKQRNLWRYVEIFQRGIWHQPAISLLSTKCAYLCNSLCHNTPLKLLRGSSKRIWIRTHLTSNNF